MQRQAINTSQIELAMRRDQPPAPAPHPDNLVRGGVWGAMAAEHRAQGASAYSAAPSRGVWGEMAAEHRARGPGGAAGRAAPGILGSVSLAGSTGAADRGCCADIEKYIVPQQVRMAQEAGEFAGLTVDLGYTIVALPASEMQEKGIIKSMCLMRCCPCCLAGPIEAVSDFAKGGGFMTWIFLVSCIDVVIMIICASVYGFDAENAQGGPSNCALFRMGARWTPAILLHNQAWRLFAPIFLHGGVLHLLMNVAAQVVIGIQAEFKWGMEKLPQESQESRNHTHDGRSVGAAEAGDASGHYRSTLPLWGTGRVLGIYLLSGVLGNVLASVAEGTKGNLGVGASGAILGLIGGEAIFLWSTWKLWEDQQRFGRARGMGLSLVFIVIVGAAANKTIDNWAHLGGFLAGLVFGCFAHFKNFTDKGLRIVVGLTGFVGLCGWAGMIAVLLTHTKQQQQHLPGLCAACLDSELDAAEADMCATAIQQLLAES